MTWYQFVVVFYVAERRLGRNRRRANQLCFNEGLIPGRDFFFHVPYFFRSFRASTVIGGIKKQTFCHILRQIHSGLWAKIFTCSQLYTLMYTGSMEMNGISHAVYVNGNFFSFYGANEIRTCMSGPMLLWDSYGIQSINCMNK